jgi:hypothetical protein
MSDSDELTASHETTKLSIVHSVRDRVAPQKNHFGRVQRCECFHPENADVLDRRSPPVPPLL